MHFWSNSPVTLHVLDGTNQPIENEQLKSIGDNVHYYHMPYSYEERFGRSTEFIDTPYVSLLCDDEFFIPSALNHCINELNTHKDFIAYAGCCLGFHSSKKGISGVQFQAGWRNITIDGATATERIIAHMNPYKVITTYAVQTADTWKKTMKILTKHKFSSPYVPEFQFEFATSYQGKSKVIEELMCLRNLENDAIDFQKWNRNLPLGKWIKNPLNEEEVKIFYEHTASELAKINGADKEKILTDIQLAVKSHWLQYAVNSPKELLRNRLLEIIPKGSKRALEQMNVNLRWRQIIKEAEKMQKDGVIIDIMQLQSIIDFIGKFYELEKSI
jgi:glycosyltransferase domain-containing protein